MSSRDLQERGNVKETWTSHTRGLGESLRRSSAQCTTFRVIGPEMVLLDPPKKRNTESGQPLAEGKEKRKRMRPAKRRTKVKRGTGKGDQKKG